MSDTFDLLLTGGTVLNPASGVRQELDVAVKDGRIAALEAKLPRAQAKSVIEMPGCYVTPGLIDFHVHSFWGVNPYGCELDALCMSTGVTTAIDAGSSGPINFKGFRKLVYEPSKTRMIAFIALAFGAWFLIGVTGAVSPLFLPALEDVFQAFVALVQTAQFWSAVRITLMTIAQAYSIAVLLGLLAGYLISRSRFVTQVLEPVVSGLFAIPITLFARPLVELVFGPAYAAGAGALAIQCWSGLFIFSGLVSNHWYLLEGLSRYTLYRHMIGAGINIAQRVMDCDDAGRENTQRLRRPQ